MEKIREFFGLQKFADRWTSEFNKHYKGIVQLMKGHFSTERDVEAAVKEANNNATYQLNEAMNSVFDLVFAIIVNSKVNLKNLAKTMDNKELLAMTSNKLLHEIDEVAKAQEEKTVKKKAKNKK